MDARVLSHRGPKVELDPFRPYHHLHEEEVGHDGHLRSVNTVFLTNRECPFRCVMCDLWRHTLDESAPEGAVPGQIRWAFERLPPAEVVKLYNNGNFFDPGAIRPSEYPEIAELVGGFERVVVENHPRLTTRRVFEFDELLDGRLEIAMGVETVHPRALERLNKGVTVPMIAEAAARLWAHDIDLRAFVLLNPPFLTDPEEARRWCLASVRFAFDHGFSAVTIIPVRKGNGMMEVLERAGEYRAARLDELASVFQEALSMGEGRVFVDTWDLDRFADDPAETGAWRVRLERMNRQQGV